jgi:hypothetical protein
MNVLDGSWDEINGDIYMQVIYAYPSATLRTRFPQKSGHLILNFGLTTLTGICARNFEIRFFFAQL